jgi:exonuclease III
MKIASWNVNSIRSRLEHVKSWLGERQPDVLLLQELKGTAALHKLGYALDRRYPALPLFKME